MRTKYTVYSERADRTQAQVYTIDIPYIHTQPHIIAEKPFRETECASRDAFWINRFACFVCVCCVCVAEYRCAVVVRRPNLMRVMRVIGPLCAVRAQQRCHDGVCYGCLDLRVKRAAPACDQLYAYIACNVYVGARQV